MKAILALFACVAVANAAFTANLVQRAQPALNQAMFKVRLATGRSELQTDMAQQLQAHATDLLNQIQSAVATGHGMVSSMVAEYQNTMAQLSAMGSSVVENLQSTLGNLMSNLGNIFGGIFGRQKNLGNIINAVQNFDVSTALTNAINGLIAHATELVSQLDIQSLLQSVFGNVLSQITGRGIFSNMWEGITSMGSSAWAAVQQMFDNVATTAGSTMNMVQQMAADFVQDASTNIQIAGSAAAQQMAQFLAPYASDLGTMWTQIQNIASGFSN